MLDKIAFGIITTLIFISLVILFCVLFVKLHIRKVTNYNKLIFQKDIDFQKNLTKTVIETQEHVLNSVSRDLHDDAGQQLTYLNLQVENLKLDSEQLREKLEPISESLRQLSASIRGISHSLNNQIVLHTDLLQAIKREAERVSSAGITVSCNLPAAEWQPYSPDQRVVIYRIFQEILNNALKHSAASKISVEVTENPFKLVISDDGKGFDVQMAEDQSSLGLKSMRARAEAIGFNLEISSSNKGTIVTLSETNTPS